MPNKRFQLTQEAGGLTRVVATIMAALALQGAAVVIRQSLGELRHRKFVPAE
jgi:hypothetical protein